MKDLLSGHEFFIPHGGIGGKGKGERVLRRAALAQDDRGMGKADSSACHSEQAEGASKNPFPLRGRTGLRTPMAAPTGNSGVTP